MSDDVPGLRNRAGGLVAAEPKTQKTKQARPRSDDARDGVRERGLGRLS